MTIAPLWQAENPHEYVSPSVEALAGPREVEWVWRVLDLEDNMVGTLDGVTGGSLTMNTYANTRLTGEMSWVGLTHSQPEWLDMRLQPVYRARFPDGEVWEQVMGVLLPTVPAIDHADGYALGSVGLYDKTLILREDHLPDDHAYSAGADPITAVRELIGASAPGSAVVIPDGDEVLRTSMFWEAGTPVLRVVNDLLDAAGYSAIWADGDGRFRSQSHLPPRMRPLVWEFNPGNASIHLPSFTRRQDRFAVPNRIIGISRDDPEAPALVAVAENTDPNDPLSYPRRGRWITRTEESVEVTSQAVLQRYVDRLLALTAEVHTTVELNHAPLPLSLEGRDRVRLVCSHVGPMDATVQSWTVDCTATALFKTTIMEVKL